MKFNPNASTFTPGGLSAAFQSPAKPEIVPAKNQADADTSGAASAFQGLSLNASASKDDRSADGNGKTSSSAASVTRSGPQSLQEVPMFSSPPLTSSRVPNMELNYNHIR